MANSRQFVGPPTESFTNPTGPPNAIIAIREIDLAGNIVREISLNDLNSELQAAGYNLTLQQFHHDVTPLPNGHWLVLPQMLRNPIPRVPSRIFQALPVSWATSSLISTRTCSACGCGMSSITSM